MIISAKPILAGAASLLGVALAAGGLLLGTGVLTAADDPGQVLQMSGVGPVSATSGAPARPHTSTTPATTHAATPTATPTATPAAPRGSVGQVAPPAAQTLPSYRVVAPSPSAPAQPVTPQQSHHGPEPVHSSPSVHMEGH